MNQLERYLEELDHQLNISHRRRAAVLEEVRDHILESAYRLETAGSTRADAEANAISAFGNSKALARQFNAEAGTGAMRKAPFIALGTGASVVVSFLAAVIVQPHATAPASWSSQATFFMSVIAMQIAIVASLCAVLRALAIWPSAASAGNTRYLVKRCSIISMMALLFATLAMTTNFVIALNRSVKVNAPALVFGGLAMLIAAALGLFATIRLKVNGSDDDEAAAVFQTPSLLAMGDRALSMVRRYPVASVTIATILASAWTLSHAETSSLASALPWGIAEALSVIAGFIFLGPALGLRSTADPSGRASVD